MVSKKKTAGQKYPADNPLNEFINGWMKADCRFKIRGVKRIYCFCNRDGLFYIDVNKYIDRKISNMMIRRNEWNLKK